MSTLLLTVCTDSGATFCRSSISSTQAMFGDRPALRQYVTALKANDEVDAVGIYDDQGRLLAGFTHTGLADRLENVLNPVSAPGRIMVETPRPVVMVSALTI